MHVTVTETLGAHKCSLFLAAVAVAVAAAVAAAAAAAAAAETVVRISKTKNKKFSGWLAPKPKARHIYICTIQTTKLFCTIRFSHKHG